MKNILLATTLLLGQMVFSQTWFKLSDLSPNVVVKQLEVSDSGVIYTLTVDNNVFYSTDGGDFWQAVNPPPTNTYLASPLKMCVNKSNGRLFVGNSGYGISYTSDFGASWGQEFFSTNPNTGVHESIVNIATSGNNVLISGNFDFSLQSQRNFYSNNNGNTWTGPILSPGIANDILIDGDTWLVMSSGGLLKSTNSGSTWSTLAFTDSQQKCRYILKSNSGTYYAVIQNIADFDHFEVYESPDLVSWDLIHSFESLALNAVSYAPNGGALLLAMQEGLLRLDLSSNQSQSISTDVLTDAEEGADSDDVYYCASNIVGVRIGSAPAYDWWNAADGFSSSGQVSGDKFIIRDNVLYAISGVNRLVGKMDGLNPEDWQYSFAEDATNPSGATNTFLDANDSKLFVGSNKNLYASWDSGMTWSSISHTTQIPFNTAGVHDFKYFGVGKDNSLFSAQSSDGGRVRKSTDSGSTWQEILDDTDVQGIGQPAALAYNNVVSDAMGKIYVSYFGLSLQNKLLSSIDNGASWINSTPSGFSAVGSAYTMEIGSSNEVYFLAGAKIYQLSGSSLILQSVPWDVNDTEITRLYMAFDANAQMTVNVSGTEFCQDCGVYHFDGSQWENFNTPDIVSDHTPIIGLALLQDGTPMVQTNFSNALSPADTMGYYYYSEEELSAEESTKNSAAIYPNPARDFVNISSRGGAQVTVFNATGQSVGEFYVFAGVPYRLNTASFCQGIYLLRLKTGSLSELKKLIIK